MDPFKMMLNVRRNGSDESAEFDDDVNAALDSLDWDKQRRKQSIVLVDDVVGNFYDRSSHDVLASCRSCSSFMQKDIPESIIDFLSRGFVNVEQARIEREQQSVFRREHFRMTINKVLQDAQDSINPSGSSLAVSDPYAKFIGSSCPDLSPSTDKRVKRRHRRNIIIMLQKTVEAVLRVNRNTSQDPFTKLMGSQGSPSRLSISEMADLSHQLVSDIDSVFSIEVPRRKSIQEHTTEDPYSNFLHYRQSAANSSYNVAHLSGVVHVKERAMPGDFKPFTAFVDPFPNFYRFYDAEFSREASSLSNEAIINFYKHWTVSSVAKYVHTNDFRTEHEQMTSFWNTISFGPLEELPDVDKVYPQTQKAAVLNSEPDDLQSALASSDNEGDRSHDGADGLQPKSGGRNPRSPHRDTLVTQEKRTIYSRFPSVDAGQVHKRSASHPGDVSEQQQEGNRVSKTRHRKVTVTLVDREDGDGSKTRDHETIEIIHTRTKQVSSLEMEDIVDRLSRPLDRSVKSRAVKDLLRQAKAEMPRHSTRRNQDVQRMITRLSEVPQWKKDAAGSFEPSDFENLLRRYTKIVPSPPSGQPSEKRRAKRKLRTPKPQNLDDGRPNIEFHGSTPHLPNVEHNQSITTGRSNQSIRDEIVQSRNASTRTINRSRNNSPDGTNPKTKVMNWLTNPAMVPLHSSSPWLQRPEMKPSMLRRIEKNYPGTGLNP